MVRTEVYTENKKVVKGIKCHAFNDLTKDGETYDILKSTLRSQD